MNRQHAQLRATEIKAKNAAARLAVEQAKAAEISPVVAEQPVDAAVVEANAAVKAARETLDHLRGRKLVSEAKAADLGSERTQISFRGHGSGDPAALSRLSVIHREISEHSSELASIESAIAEAERRVKQAEGAAARALEKQHARETLVLLDDLSTAGADCDRALKAFLQAFDRLEKTAAAAYRVTGTPSHEIVAALGRRALCSALLSHKRVFELEQLAPTARTTFAAMAAAWSRVVRHWCNQRLGVAMKQDKAA
jgi:hypothetical protein